jgi:hypothetical protein
MRRHIPALDAGFYLAALAYVLVLLDLRPGSGRPAVVLGNRRAARARMRRIRLRRPGERAELADRGLPAIAVDTWLGKR